MVVGPSCPARVGRRQFYDPHFPNGRCGSFFVSIRPEESFVLTVLEHSVLVAYHIIRNTLNQTIFLSIRPKAVACHSLLKGEEPMGKAFWATPKGNVPGSFTLIVAGYRVGSFA